MSAGFPQEHPAPHRDRVSIVTLMLALAAGPAAWIAQLMLGYGLSSYACFPAEAPRLHSPPPGWGREHEVLLAINVACLALALSGTAMAYRSWRRSHQEKAGDAHLMLEIGEGRTRFLSLCGLLASLLFALAIFFNTIPVAGVPACWSIGR